MSGKGKEKAKESEDKSEGEKRLHELPLPAVKGTIGAIESPRRHRASPSISTMRDDQGDETLDMTSQASTYTRPTAADPNQPIFRADPKMKTTFDTLNIEGKEELKRLFLLS